MNIRNQKKIIILLAVFTIIVVVFNKSYALFQTTAVSDKSVVQITTPDKFPSVLDKAKAKTCSNGKSPIIEDTDGTIYLSGDNECIDFNYVWYSGKLWRVTAINPDGTMKMITQDAITTIFWNDTATYKDSWIQEWLNEDFKDTLYNYENIIVQNASWNATSDGTSTEDNVTKPPVDGDGIVHGDVGLLNLYEYYQSYKNLGDVDNDYLNIGYYFWLITPKDTSTVWSVIYGNLRNHQSSSNGFSIRPSVNLKSDIELIGEGTKSNPYTITIDKEPGKSGELINTRISGEYVKVDNKVYRIVGIEKETTKLISADYIRDESDTVITKKFGSTSSYATSVSSGSEDYWGYYLNNTWLTDNLKNYITEGTYYLGQVITGTSYKNSICSENNTSETTKNCEKTTNTWTGLVGLPRVGEMFSAQLGEGYSTSSNIWLITPNGSIVRFVDNSDGLTSNSLSSLYGVRPSINLKSEVKISGGSGTERSPYEVKIGD